MDDTDRVAPRHRLAERIEIAIAVVGGSLVILAGSLALLIFLLLLILRLALGTDGSSGPD